MNDATSHLQDAKLAEANRLADASFLELIRTMAREGGIETPLSDQDAERVLAYFTSLEGEYRPLPPEGMPEFIAELQRRATSNAPEISPRTVVAVLRGTK